MFDSRRAFGIQLPALARNSPALLYAILAISARQMERKRGAQDSFDSIELYQEAIRLLTPLLQVRDQKVVATCVLLCCLEMMSASAQDWRRHLEGCAALFDAFGIHGFGSELPQAVFWCYARMGEFFHYVVMFEVYNISVQACISNTDNQMQTSAVPSYLTALRARFSSRQNGFLLKVVTVRRPACS